jgi:NAD(P)-dependent dehydrogenase (short-subunit alcohol dehydrogenase family)
MAASARGAQAAVMAETQSLYGKVAVVTGATTGIGKEIARGLAALGARVVIGARTRERGEAARREIVESTGNRDVVVLQIDVASIASVRAFVDELSASHDRVDILVNNAGIWVTDRSESVDRHELTFATNVLGPYLLTTLLADRLRAAGSARVVNVVSALAQKYDATDLEYTRRKFSGFDAYAQSKAALRMLTWGFARRFAGTAVTVNAAAPGFVKSEFNRSAKGFMAAMIGFSSRLFAVSPAKGADTPLWVATAPELAGKSGAYFDARTKKEGKFDDTAAIAELERICGELTGAPPITPAVASVRAAG